MAAVHRAVGYFGTSMRVLPPGKYHVEIASKQLEVKRALLFRTSFYPLVTAH